MVNGGGNKHECFFFSLYFCIRCDCKQKLRLMRVKTKELHMYCKCKQVLSLRLSSHFFSSSVKQKVSERKSAQIP